MDWSDAFDRALPYDAFLGRHATPEQRARWDASHGRITLAPAQRARLEGFRRRMPTLVMAGAWCGDCVDQCPIFDHFARVAPAIGLRLIDRDALPALRDALAINGGHRVPVVVFLSEDFQEVARFGDRTLAKYEQLAAEGLGAACPTGLVPPGEALLGRVVGEWLDQFERAELILRLSPRLRARHGD